MAEEPGVLSQKEAMIIWRTRSRIARWCAIMMFGQMAVMHWTPNLDEPLAGLIKLSIMTCAGIVGWYMGMRTVDNAFGKGMMP